jgi:7,8-dihydropterin-6-yl-methyl-4-(beta-D-ribofuranosyl)aminobenzene 5'-phosphate synthase
MADFKITALVENTAGGRGLLAEHGISFWIEPGQKKMLFDTGQGLALKHNAQCLGIPLESVDSIILSHGHYDHTGGLSNVLSLAEHPRVFVHAQAFAPKYARNADDSVRDVGMVELTKQDVRSMANLSLVYAPTEIGEGLWCTGPIPRTNKYEDTGGAFFKDKECRIPDEIYDDQAAFLETKSGTVVILGCAHAGVINTLHFIRTLTDKHPIHAVLGGMHLFNASSQRMEATIAELRRLGIERLMPCHCTGFAAMAHLWNEFPGKCEAIPVDTVIRFEN